MVKGMRYFMVIVVGVILTNCASTSSAVKAEQPSQPNIPVAQAPSPQEPAKPGVVIGTTIKQPGHGYAIEVMPNWDSLATSGTPGQEKVFRISHPDLPARHGRANIMNVVFVNRFNATPDTMVDIFMRRYARTQVKTRKAIPGGYWLVTVENTPGERNSLMFTRILFNTETKQAISYSLNMQVTGDVEALRNSTEVDKVAEALLNLFYLEPLA